MKSTFTIFALLTVMSSVASAHLIEFECGPNPFAAKNYNYQGTGNAKGQVFIQGLTQSSADYVGYWSRGFYKLDPTTSSISYEFTDLNGNVVTSGSDNAVNGYYEVEAKTTTSRIVMEVGQFQINLRVDELLVFFAPDKIEPVLIGPPVMSAISKDKDYRMDCTISRNHYL